MARAPIVAFLLGLGLFELAGSDLPQKVSDNALTLRYAPHVDADFLSKLELVEQSSEVWWSTPRALREARTESCSPLKGLHLAIDPGHIGGVWAEWEGRNFRIKEEDFWVREGELVLEVAQRVRTHLSELGAEVTLLRESFESVNPRSPLEYWDLAAQQIEKPSESTITAQIDHAVAIRNRAVQLAIVVGELKERARVVNEDIRPDALISLHINAAPWPDKEAPSLVKSDHTHVLIFGCLSERELSSRGQQRRLARKMSNGSGAIELTLGRALATSLAEGTRLPASEYEGRNAVRVDSEDDYLWARNLMLLRLVDCPTVLLEPYIANSETGYTRIQKALQMRAQKAPLGDDDILVEYSDAVVRGILNAYGSVD